MPKRLPATIRTITFTTAGYLFALPMQAVLKVSHCPQPTDESFDEVGLFYLGNETVAILELGDRLGLSPAASSPEQRFLILVRATSGELYGIQIGDLPNMFDLPTAQIRPLPPKARQSPLRQVAKYAARCQADEREQLLLLLDLSLLSAAGQKWAG